jgi:hypothetical protein
MKTILYEDITTNELYTKMELQELWENMWCCYVTDEEIDDIIFENLVQNGGNIQIVNDNLLDLCNRIAIACESERYFTSWEQDENIKAYYESINCNGDFKQDIIQMLENYEEFELIGEIEKY